MLLYLTRVHLSRAASQAGSQRGSHGLFVPQQWLCRDLPRGSLLPAGIFVYPLEESEVVAGFEAAVGSRRVTFQIQNRHRVQDCCLQCSPSPGRLRHCASGKCCAWVMLLGAPGQEAQNG